MMIGLNPNMLKTLAITPDGKCVKHPHVSLLCEPTSPTAAANTHPPPLQECEWCWKEQQERKNNQSGTDLTLTTSVSISPSEIAAVVPPSLQNMQSGTTLPSGSSKATEAVRKQYAEWTDTVMTRWNQVQEIGNGGSSSSAGTLTLDNHQEEASLSLPLISASSHSSVNPTQQQNNHAFNMSMAAVAEEPDERHSEPSQSYHTTAASSTAAAATAPINKAPWTRLEEQVQRQEESILKLQETIQHQETSIRQELQHLIHLVSNLASSLPQQQENYNRDIALEALQTPANSVANNKQSTGLPQMPHQPPLPANTAQSSSTPPPQRPLMYRKSDHHPANIFTSVRTIERKPPKPPMRHGSFSTNADSRRQSVGSETQLASIISSLETSTLNDATTYNDTTVTNNTVATPLTPPRISRVDNSSTARNDDDGNHNINAQTAAAAAAPPTPTEAEYAPGLESMLERARTESASLEIIFDASGILTTDSLHAKENGGHQEDDDDEEKKSGCSGCSPHRNRSINDRASSPPLRQSTGSGSSPPTRSSFTKSPGSIRLTIPDDDDVVEDDDNKPNDTAALKPPNLRSRSPSPPKMYTARAPARIQRKKTPPFQSHESHHPLRQPRRELSVADVTTEKEANPHRRIAPPHGRASEGYVPPPPPPSTPSNNHNNYHRGDAAKPSNRNTRLSTGSNPLARLHPSNLQSKLGPSTAPPRREIFATGQSKLQISMLTIDSSLMTNDSEPNANGTAACMKYREVSNMLVTDKFGDKGIYTGNLREEEMEGQEINQGAAATGRLSPRRRIISIPHGPGTMNYEGGRFYKGEWRDGHWHGRGLLRNANGDTYEGEFVYDARHGKGIYKYENGDVYEGDFTEDKRHGKGTFMFHNGSIYRGDFVNGDFEGYGWYEFDDGYYEGEWKNGAYHGIGTLQYTDGGSYTGRFFEGKAHGHGEEKDADGTIRRGVWNKGKLTGSQ